MFEPLPSQFSFPQSEERVLAFWEKHDIFQKSLDIRCGAPRFVFYEGPPTANGLPHPGHCLTRAIKDLFPRYKTMCGCLVERKAGWDTHGLPVEVEVCKELGIHTKEEIEAYGVEKFVQRCIESVFRYVGEWEQMTRRLGFWVNLEDAYVTFHQSYVESVWWSLKTLFERGLLYQGHKVVWWWAQGGTALSAGEVGEGYRTVQDPSVYVRFPLVAEGAEGPRGQGAEGAAPRALPHLTPGSLGPSDPSRVSLLVWTTTPWTLISNHFCAVGPDIDYALVRDKTTDEYLYIASALVQDVANKVKHDFEVVGLCKGSDLVGLCYVPPFPSAYYERGAEYHAWWNTARGIAPTGAVSAPCAMGDLLWPVGRWDEAARCMRWDVDQLVQEHVGWRILAAPFVTLDTGTGLVHQAPAYGEVDFNLLREESQRFFGGLPLLNAVAPDGTFTDEAPPAYRGRWVKDCDAEIVRELKDRGILYHQETVEHEYPFCPRAEDDPLIQYARKSWFVRTSQFKDEFLKNNAGITWLPEHIREGRFGDFLRNNVDWALSRERYWGTPLPIWVCEKTGKMEAIGCYAELLAKPGVQGTEVWEQAKAANPNLPEHLKVHKPYIDAVTYDSPFGDDEPGAQATGQGGEGSRGQGVEGPRGRGVKGEGEAPGEPNVAAGLRAGRSVAAGPHTGRDVEAGLRPGRPRMQRVPEVIDCWWDAGSMPFAQWGFPHLPGSVDTFVERFPCDFISEALDQTRGWFYGLLAISTLLFSKGSAGVSPADADAHSLGSAGVSPASHTAPVRPGIIHDGITESLHTRRRWRIPHWEAGGSTYFITFRVQQGELSPEERAIVLDACKHWDGTRFLLHAAVVLPDHVHLLMTPKEKAPGQWWSIADLMHSIKSYSAKEINRRRGTTGRIWQPEYYDRIVRTAADFEEKWEYVVTNAERKGLGDDYPWVWAEPAHADGVRSDSRGGRDARTPRSGRDARTPLAALLPQREYPHPYKACIVLGLMMGEDGLKMSKRKKNYREPSYIFDHYGADAMRWFLFSGQTPWTSVRFQEQNIRDAQREFLVRLYNVFSFFNIYANIDGFEPVRGPGAEGARGQGVEGARAEGRSAANATCSETTDDTSRSHVPTFPRSHATGWRAVGERGELDRWITSELHRTIRFVRESMDRFENYPAAGRINDFVDALSNWYVRRSRERFWRPVQGAGNGEEGTGSRERGTGSRERGTGNREQGTGTGEQGLRDSGIEGLRRREPGAGTGEQEASAAGRDAGADAPVRSHVPTFPSSHVPTPPRSPADQDKWDAYNTLYEVLLTLSRLIAPFTPFFAETMYQNLVRGQGAEGPRGQGKDDATAPSAPGPLGPSAPPLSVHLCDYPAADEALIDEKLAAEMDLVREVVSLGRAARTAAKLKVRQPLARAEIILARSEHAEWLAAHSDLIAEELNIKRVELTAEAEHYVTYQVKPDFKAIGPKFGKLAPRVAAALARADAAEVRRAMTTSGRVTLDVDGQPTTLMEQDVEVRLEAKPGWSAAQGRAGVVVVKTELTDELRDEGLCRELIHQVQAMRKSQDLPYEARITLYVQGTVKLADIAGRFAATIQSECLVSSIQHAPPPAGAATQTAKIEGHELTLGIVAT